MKEWKNRNTEYLEDAGKQNLDKNWTESDTKKVKGNLLTTRTCLFKTKEGIDKCCPFHYHWPKIGVRNFTPSHEEVKFIREMHHGERGTGRKLSKTHMEKEMKKLKKFAVKVHQKKESNCLKMNTLRWHGWYRSLHDI